MPNHIQRPAAQHRSLCRVSLPQAEGRFPPALCQLHTHWRCGRSPPTLSAAQRGSAQPVTGGGRARGGITSARGSAGGQDGGATAGRRGGAAGAGGAGAPVGPGSGRCEGRPVREPRRGLQPRGCGGRARAEDGHRPGQARRLQGTAETAAGARRSIRAHLTLRLSEFRRGGGGGAVSSAQCVVLIPCACRIPRPMSCCLPS